MNNLKKWTLFFFWALLALYSIAQGEPPPSSLTVPAWHTLHLPNQSSETMTYKNWFYRLRYLKSEEAQSLLEHSRGMALSTEGKLIQLPHSRLLFIRDRADHLPLIQQLIQGFDQRRRQVKITAKIVNVDRQYIRSLGINFRTTQGLQSGTRALNVQSAHLGEAVIPLSTSGDNTQLELVLSALEKQGHAQILSEPQLLTTVDHAALIESGEEIPYQQATGIGNTSIAFKKAVLKLAVTPTLQAKQTFLLHIDVNQDQIANLQVNGVPAIHTQHIQTEALTRNQHTLVLGGILLHHQQQAQSGVPGFQSIPVLGHLFQHRRLEESERELLIFITPSWVP